MSSSDFEVRQILHNMGYNESAPGSNMFVKKKCGDMLSDSFYRVASNTIKEMGIPKAPEITHADFVIQNAYFIHTSIRNG